MNNRIKEMYVLAEQYAYDNEDQWLPGPGWREICRDKFADLLIDDIIKVLEGLPSQYQDYRSQIEESMQNYCIQSIINHFKDEK